MVTTVADVHDRAGARSRPYDHCRSRLPGVYRRPMTASVHDVAAAIHRRLPGLPQGHLHKLLYYCQGHSLALAGRPMFANRIVAAADGPRIDGLAADGPRIGGRAADETRAGGRAADPPRIGGQPADETRAGGLAAGGGEPQRLDRVYANTVLHVIGRYGGLSGRDLARLTRSEAPWAGTPAGGEISHQALRRFFSTDGAPDGADDPRLADPVLRRELRRHLEDRRAAEAAGHDR